mmetsp:Transcript_5463/g.16911  ORF Transcript_5463/g.16911 Transcript_5463/m.16911 type:complete len:217 (+) Transcript_5463:976-1626(+)
MLNVSVFETPALVKTKAPVEDVRMCVGNGEVNSKSRLNWNAQPSDASASWEQSSSLWKMLLPRLSAQSVQATARRRRTYRGHTTQSSSPVAIGWNCPEGQSVHEFARRRRVVPPTHCWHSPSPSKYIPFITSHCSSLAFSFVALMVAWICCFTCRTHAWARSTGPSHVRFASSTTSGGCSSSVSSFCFLSLSFFAGGGKSGLQHVSPQEAPMHLVE